MIGLGRFVEKLLDKAGIDLVERQPVGNRFGRKGAQALRLDLRYPARRLAVFEARRRTELTRLSMPRVRSAPMQPKGWQ
jgi:hypothetical protein